jgi:hypothetical protein
VPAWADPVFYGPLCLYTRGWSRQARGDLPRQGRVTAETGSEDLPREGRKIRTLDTAEKKMPTPSLDISKKEVLANLVHDDSSNKMCVFCTLPHQFV